MDVVVDTGSIELVLPSLPCDLTSSGLSSRACSAASAPAAFLSNDSSTFTASSLGVNIAYGTGSASCAVAHDVVSIGELSAANVTFAACAETSGLNVTGSPVSGILGVPSHNPASSLGTNLWEALGATSIGIFQNRNNQTGALTIGGDEPSLYTGQINYNDVVNATSSFWELKLDAIHVGIQLLGLEELNPTVVIDSGTSVLALPVSTLDSMFSAVPGSQAIDTTAGQSYAVPCDMTLNITFTFGNISYVIQPQDIVQQGPITTGGLCQVNAISSDSISGIPPYILGAPFLQSVYTVYRFAPAAVGFATLSSQASDFSAKLTDALVPVNTSGTAQPAVSTATAKASGQSLSRGDQRPATGGANDQVHVSEWFGTPAAVFIAGLLFLSLAR
ncbi:uncharacterized protein L969DRAFT_46255 [Mixia osmundae IAM 14324]|uniref:Peptidase A1 domain-containing protein n=1 Tax=Mixia osmundae (strain CBS 9802 / IAM 14324 / JCM 22182 / KY 12970) TaxID=764103 RepID=G7E8H5_MIXOS|nr:uncharacterized protein L969DRAFT_46255 [Mixia osmundae IAM 14324]KEI40911.1 hypothetical protein L969DRAFT_46255 [Mixia osmundae IAM 14324]GAA99135.1 hypothetical protein E5Q_05825 [Mixia osmundae IAM 14324]